MKIKYKKYYFQIETNRFFFFYKKLFGWNFKAYALYPFILIRKKYSKNVSLRLGRRGEKLQRHELTHIYQQLELLVGVWCLWYWSEYCYFRYYRKFTSKQSYYAISFEQEAYLTMHDPDYLSRRKLFAWREYFWKSKFPPLLQWNGKEERFEIIVDPHRT